MPILTLEAIRKNPWNVLTHAIPADPGQLLLEAARRAATYCRDSEYALVLAARSGDYVPAWWSDAEDLPDAHEESEDLSFRADDKLHQISEILEVETEPAG